MALGLTQPLTEMITGKFPWGEGGRCVGLPTLPPSCADCLEMGASTCWNPQGLSRPVMGLLYLLSPTWPISKNDTKTLGKNTKKISVRLCGAL